MLAASFSFFAPDTALILLAVVLLFAAIYFWPRL
jgi:hypothetical protein